MCNHCKSKSLIGVLKHINALGPNGVCDRCLERVSVLLYRIRKLEVSCDKMLTQITEGG